MKRNVKEREKYISTNKFMKNAKYNLNVEHESVA